MQTVNEELKPCPFCGGEAYLREALSFSLVQCLSCRANAEMCGTNKEAIAAWNRRVVDDAIKQILRQLGETT